MAKRLAFTLAGALAYCMGRIAPIASSTMTITQRVRQTYHRTSRSTLLAALLIATGCRTGGRGGGAGTRVDKLMEAYPELQGGRFAVIADFEDSKHMEIVQFIGVSEKAQCTLDRKRGRRDTGRGCLKLRTASPHDTVVVNNEYADQWFLKRDWRPYDLLMMEIKSPKPDLQLDVSIAAGQPQQRHVVSSSVALKRGWNTVRLGLAEVGEYLPLDDVQEIRLSVSGSKKPIEVYFDNVILAGHRVDLFGDPENKNAELYITRAGRRWKVGAGGRFELTFANGQIVGWHNLAEDPYRLQNLVQGTTLGPSPMLIESPGADREPDFSNFGQMVVARQRIVEMNPVRIVIDTEWRFVNDTDESLENRPFHRWVYTIYRTGQLYVATECTAQAEDWDNSSLGLAVTIASTRDDDLRTFSPASDAAATTPWHPAFASARSQEGKAVLLYVLDDGPSTRIVEQFEKKRRRASFVAIRPAREAPTETWACHLLLGPSDAVTDEEAVLRAADYARPAELKFELGSSVTAAGAHMNPTGFDQAAGCYVIQPDQGRIRFWIDASEQPLFSPAFRIINTQGRDAWVYVDHLIFDEVARDAEGDLIFQLPSTLTDNTLIEVLLRRPQQNSGA